MDELQAYVDNVYLMLFPVHSNLTLHFGDVCQSDWRLYPPPQSIAHESPKLSTKIPVKSWACILLVLLPLHLLFCLCLLSSALLWSKQESCSHWFPWKSIQDLGKVSFHTWHSKQLPNLHQTFLLAQSFATPLPSTSLLVFQPERS